MSNTVQMSHRYVSQLVKEMKQFNSFEEYTKSLSQPESLKMFYLLDPLRELHQLIQRGPPVDEPEDMLQNRTHG